jgi:hypothetical protein
MRATRKIYPSTLKWIHRRGQPSDLQRSGYRAKRVRLVIELLAFLRDQHGWYKQSDLRDEFRFFKLSYRTIRRTIHDLEVAGYCRTKLKDSHGLCGELWVKAT